MGVESEEPTLRQSMIGSTEAYSLNTRGSIRVAFQTADCGGALRATASILGPTIVAGGGPGLVTSSRKKAGNRPPWLLGSQGRVLLKCQDADRERKNYEAR